MKSTVLVVVDLQNDFFSGGAMAVPDAEAVLPVANRLMRDFRRVVATQDWHPAGHVSFASSHPGRAPFDRLEEADGGRILWPDHCVEGTHGASLHPALELPSAVTVVRKGIRAGMDAYSGFFENDRTTPVGLDAILRAWNAEGILLVGLATDYCVLHTALDGRALGYAVTVIESGCRGIDPEGSAAIAWDRMDRAGVCRG